MDEQAYAAYLEAVDEAEDRAELDEEGGAS